MLSGVTWQQQSNYDGQSAVNPDTRSLRGLALSSDGTDLYDGFVSGAGTGAERTIEVSSAVNPSYTSLNAIDPTGAAGSGGVVATTGNLAGQPKGVATDNRGYVYMTVGGSTSSTGNNFDIFNSSLTTLVGQATSTSSPASQLSGIAVEQIGNQYYMYLAHNKGASTIERWNVTDPAHPALDTSWGPAGSNGILNLKTLTGSVGAYPNGLTVAADGTLYVAGGVQAAGTQGNARGDSVFKISADGTTLLAENTSVPGAMDVALYGGNVYVSEYGNVTNVSGTTTLPIMELSQSNLTYIQTLNIVSGGGDIQPHINGTTNPGTDSGLSGIDISSSGEIYVVDQQYDLTSNYPIQYDQILVSSPLDQSAPLVTNAEVNGSATPSPIEYSPSTPITVTGTIDDSTTGGSTIASAGFTVDGGATVYSLTVVGTPTNNGETENVTGTFSLSALGLTTLGSHSITIQGTDSAGFTGYSTAVPFTLQDTTKPVVSNVQVMPSSIGYDPSSGMVTLSATVTDNFSVASAQYSTDGGSTWLPMTGTFGGTSVNVSSTFSLASAGFTTPNMYTLLVRGQDSSANISDSGSTTLTVTDDLPPLVSNVQVNGSVTPAPIDYDPSATITVTGTIDDSTTGGSTIVSAGFTVDGGATVFAMTVVGMPTNGGETENVTGTFTLAQLGITTVGSHSVVVQGTDATNNTGFSSPPLSFSIVSIPAQLAVSTQPPVFVAVGQGFSFAVTAENASGYLASSFTGNVTVALSGGPGMLGGTLVAQAVAGVATFSGLTISQVGSGYTLQATTSGLTSATSNPINVVAPVTPILAINGGFTNYATTFQPGGVSIENGVTIADVNTISGATVQLIYVPDGANESLTVNLGVSGLTSMYNAANGTLTITGLATIDTYESVLGTVKYSDVAVSPNTATRNIQFMVTDAMNLKSNVAVATVSFINDYTEASGPGSTQAPNVDTPNPTIVIDSSGVVSATSVTSATISISSGFVSSTEDVLGLSNQFQQNFHITLSSPVAGEIVLTGTNQTTPAEYQIEMDNITYTDTAHVFAPSDLLKTFTFTILTNTGYSVSNVKTYNIVPVDTNPTVTTTSAALTYTALSDAQLVDPGVTVTDPDPLSVTSATVSISSGFFVGQDTLSETATLPMGVSALYNSSAGILTLTGSASLSQYQTLLAGVAYTNSGLNLSSRTISFVVNTGSLGSNVTGNNRYTKTITMTPATVTRYDFNSNASTSTASGAPGFIGVGPGRGYSQSAGYGFSDAVTNFTPFTASAVETIAGISSTYAPMYENGIVSPINSPQEFTFSTTVGTTYDLRVYVGNPNVSTNNIQVTIYTGSITNLLQTQIGQMSGISTTAGGSSAFAAVEIDGMTAGGVTTAAGSEITVVIKSTSGNAYTEGLDVALTGNLPPIAHQDPAGGIAPAGSLPVAALTTSELQPVVAQAIADWAAAGITPAQVASLQSTQFVISNLEGQGALALAGSNTVQIDATADGYGWFVDPAVADQPAAGSMDLLTVVTHELGHILGLVDVSAAQLPNDLMDTTLPTGTRRLPSSADMAALVSGSFVPTTTSATSSASTAAVLATSPSAGSSSSSTSGIDQALAQVGVPAADDASESDEDGSLETASALDSFFTLLG